jgi:hypothetical protein
MARSTEVGSELGADHRLIELLGRQLDLESEPSRRKAMVDQIAGIIDWHEMFDRRYLGANERANNADEAIGADGPAVPARTPVDLGGSRPEPAQPADETPEQATASLPLQSLLTRARRHIREEEEHTLPEFESRAHWMVLEDLGERAREIRLARSGR